MFFNIADKTDFSSTNFLLPAKVFNTSLPLMTLWFQPAQCWQSFTTQRRSNMTGACECRNDAVRGEEVWGTSMQINLNHR